MSKKSIIIAVVVIIVAGAAYYLQTQPEALPTAGDQTSMSVDQQVEDSNGELKAFIDQDTNIVTGWTTYKNDDLGFTIDRPVNWFIAGREGNRIVQFVSPRRRHRNALDSTYDFWLMRIDLFDSDGKSLADIVDIDSPQDPHMVRSKGETNINGIQGTKRVVLTFGVCTMSVYLPTSKGIYKISYESTSLDFEQLCNSGEFPDIFKQSLNSFSVTN
jgi:hypothetical protein